MATMSRTGWLLVLAGLIAVVGAALMHADDCRTGTAEQCIYSGPASILYAAAFRNRFALARPADV